MSAEAAIALDGRDLHAARLIKRAERARGEGKVDKAARLYHELLQHDPRSFDALHGLGLLHFTSGRLDAALMFCQEALKRDGCRVDGFSTLGLVFHALKDFARALTSYDAGLRLDPGNADLLNGRGVVLLELRRHEDALESFDRALACEPDHPDALANRANALLRLNRVAEAVETYDRALERTPNSAAIHANRAAALRRLDRPQEAVMSAAAALKIDPDHAHARFVESVARLTLGDFAAGWRAYESRWRIGWLASQRRDFGAPLWLGKEPLDGKTILLHAEQGMGDTIQFVRYAPLLAARGARVVLEVQAELVTLLARMPGLAVVIARKQSLPPYDFHCPLMSLPFAVGTTLDTIPAAVPYLRAAHADIAAWSARLLQGRPHVGLVWSGMRSHDNDLNRSIRLATLAPLLDLPDITFVSLQHEVRGCDADYLQSRRNVTAIGAEFRDFADTAAAIETLDAVVAVDTAVAHLAGALAKPLFLMLPFAADFRWLRERADSPWYPSARLIRQPCFGDWDSAVNLLRQQVARLPLRHGKAA